MGGCDARASSAPHDVFCLQLVGENAQSPDGAKAVVGTETVDACSEHDAT